MATITVRDLDEEVRRRLKRQAAAHNRSMEAETRAILTAAVKGPDFATAWLEMAAGQRGDDNTVWEEIAVPERSASRDIDLS